MRCLMCDEPETMYIPSDDVPNVGLYSCGACSFEFEGPRAHSDAALDRSNA